MPGRSGENFAATATVAVSGLERIKRDHRVSEIVLPEGVTSTQSRPAENDRNHSPHAGWTAVTHERLVSDKSPGCSAALA